MARYWHIPQCSDYWRGILSDKFFFRPVRRGKTRTGFFMPYSERVKGTRVTRFGGFRVSKLGLSEKFLEVTYLMSTVTSTP